MGYEQTSKYGESEIIVRFALETPATKKDVKVVFKATTLQVTVAGEEMLNGKLFGRVQTDDCTWCLVEKGAEQSPSCTCTVHGGRLWTTPSPRPRPAQCTLL